VQTWATDYLRTKTAGHAWNAIGGGIPFAYGVKQVADEHPELSEEERAKAIGGVLKPGVGYLHAIPWGLVSGVGGAGLGALTGAGIGALTGTDMGPLISSGGTLGAVLGGLGGYTYGNYQSGRDLTEEAIKDKDKWFGIYNRHPFSSAASLPLQAVHMSGAGASLLPNILYGTGLDVLEHRRKKAAEVNPLIRTTANEADPHGDEVHAPLLANPYQGRPEAADYENGYQFVQSAGHQILNQASPTEIQRWHSNSLPWRQGFADAATKMGLKILADAVMSAKTANWAKEYLNAISHSE